MAYKHRILLHVLVVPGWFDGRCDVVHSSNGMQELMSAPAWHPTLLAVENSALSLNMPLIIVVPLVMGDLGLMDRSRVDVSRSPAFSSGHGSGVTEDGVSQREQYYDYDAYGEAFGWELDERNSASRIETQRLNHRHKNRPVGRTGGAVNTSAVQGAEVCTTQNQGPRNTLPRTPGLEIILTLDDLTLDDAGPSPPRLPWRAAQPHPVRARAHARHTRSPPHAGLPRDPR